MTRGEIYWTDLGEVRGSRPAKRRPTLVIQADAFNASALRTAIVAVVTSNTQLAGMPGNVFLPSVVSGLSRDSVVNVTALITVDEDDLTEFAGVLAPAVMTEVDQGLRRVLDL